MGGRRIAVLLLVLQALAVVPGHADPGRAPTLFRHVKHDVLPGDRYDIACDGANDAGNGSFVVFFVLTNRAGTSIYGGQGEAGLGHGAPAVTIRVADTDPVEVPAGEFDPQALSSQDWSGTATYTSTLRVAWAAWTTPFSCAVSVNGAAIAPADLDSSRGVQARLRDFSGGLSADAELAGAGANLTFKREGVDGYVYSWLSAQGSASNRGPGNENVTDSRTFWVGPSTGTWTHTVAAGYAVHSVRGIILETPR